MDRRILKTKDAIRAAYLNLLIENRNSKITVTKLAKAANIDRKTFYLHYATIDEISKEIMEENLTEFEQLLIENHIFENPLDANLIMHSLNICIMKNINFYRSIANRMDFDFFAKQLKDVLVQKTVDSLALPSSLPKREVEIYSKFFLSGIIDIYADWFRSDKDMTLTELGELTSKVMHNGIKIFEKS